MHEFVSGFFGGREAPWHGLGTVIDEDTVKADRALVLAGLDWQVEKVPLIAVPTVGEQELELPIYDTVANCKVDKDGNVKYLGTVGSGFEVIQNDELLSFVEALCDTSEAIFHTAGSLRDDRVVWALAKLPKVIQILGMEDESIEQYLMATNAHDGSRALTAVITPTRVVCMNTLNLALAKAVRAWSIRHTSNAKDRMEEAQEALGIAFRYMEQFEKTAATLVHQKLTKKDFASFLEQLVPYDEKMVASIDAGEPNRAAKNVDEAREVIRSLYSGTVPNGPDNLANVRGTAWAALNAVAEYVDYTKGRSVLLEDGSPDERAMSERRFIRAVWQNDMKQRGLKLLAPKLAHARGDNFDAVARA